MRRGIAFAMTVVVVLMLVVVFAAFRDDINDSTLGFVANLFRRDAETGEPGRINFDEGRENIYALYDGRLAVLSRDRLVLYDKSGAEKVSRSVSFNNPALTVAGSRVIAYDREGNETVVADTGGVRKEFDIPVLTAAGNDRGQYVLITNESGYRSVAQLYDTKHRQTFKWCSAEYYIWSAALSPSGNRLAVAAVGQQGESIGLRVTFLDTGREEALASAEMTDELPLALFYPDNNHVCIITQSSVYFYTDDGTQLGYFSYGGQMMLSQPLTTEEALFINIGRNAGGQYSQVICLSYEGLELGRITLTEGLTDYAAAGLTCFVLEAGSLTRYVSDGTEFSPGYLGDYDASGILAAKNGDILLLYSSYGEWYNAESGSAASQGD